MRLRTLDDFEEAISAEISWRKLELTTVLFNVGEARSSKIQVSLRAGVALLYAHWEGWVKAVAQLYVEHAFEQQLCYGQLQDCFLGLALKARLTRVQEARTSHVHRDFAEFLMSGGLGERAKLSGRAIRTKGNLSSTVLRDIVERIGVSFQPYELLGPLIDRRLLEARNTIAHGEHLELDTVAYKDLHHKIVLMLNTFTDDVLAAARRRAYARSGNPPEHSTLVADGT